MRPWTTCGLLGVVAVAAMVVLSGDRGRATGTEKGKQMLAHNVYFTLKDDSPQARQQLVEACHKYLSEHPGTVFFAAGTLVEDLDREVNDVDFDVALHLVFRDRAAHDQYQDAPRHQQFIQENKENWKQVRVFDSYVRH